MIFRKVVRYVFSHFPYQILNRLKADVFHKRVVVKYLPCSLFIDVTTGCNMNCYFCSTKTHRARNDIKHLPFSTAKRILDQFKLADFVGFCGAGEPFLNPDLFKIVKYAKKLKMKVYVTTNGTLINKRINELLSSNLDILEISFKDTNNNDFQQTINSKKFKLETIISGIKELSKYPQRPWLTISYVWNRDRAHKIPQVIKIANQCRVDEVLFQNFIPDPVLKNESLCLFEEDQDWISKIIDKYRSKSSKLIIKFPNLYKRNIFSRRCNVPFKSIRIGVNGGISACPRAINPSIKNGVVISDKNIFNNMHFQKIRSELLDRKLSLRYECLYCEKR
ncbi:MAG: radical SAM/SPASM domain-containing protein [Candidatus Helarchaeota archaeon]